MRLPQPIDPLHHENDASDCFEIHRGRGNRRGHSLSGLVLLVDCRLHSGVGGAGRDGTPAGQGAVPATHP